ncbi:MULTISPECIES: RNA polymerase sigma factor [Gordonibacter]|uniref:RNA polymerase sigma factor n=1 Tax=Gordonibacter faecis TaxID=3047475 RepID=A0ABT7DJW4_9ACTN|nr:MULTISPECIES: RNA polymerase sigma factor [unclassified Gordonibacter]MDJ1649812.1 RNA polymerase sigma factor [Gordonibacter sp. KGMB12511]
MPNQQGAGPRTEAFLTQAMADWGDAVYRLALSHTRSRADAEDVYQDVFLRLYNDATVFESAEHVKAWLLRVTVNRCHDLAKSGWKQRTVELDPERDSPAVPAHNAEDADVWDAVGQLPDSQRFAVHLHYVEGYSTDEVAELLGCQPATARTWLHRARARVRELLGERGNAKPSPTAATRPRPSPSSTTHQPCPIIPFREEADHDQRPPEPLRRDDEGRQSACSSSR